MSATCEKNSGANRAASKMFGSNRSMISTHVGSNASSRSNSPAPSIASVEGANIESIDLKIRCSKTAAYWAKQRELTRTIMDFDTFMPELKDWAESGFDDDSETDSDSESGDH